MKVNPAPFSTAKALYQAVLKEGRGVPISTKMDLAGLYKELFCVAFSSEEIEKCLKECFKRCTYDNGKGDLKIDDSSFESVEARGDYMTVCMEVAKENILPFVKNLYAEYQHIMSMTPNAQA